MKMGDLKPISHKQFNEFIKGKGSKGRNDYKLKELKVKFGFKPMYNRRTLVISSEDMEPTTFDSLRKAAKATMYHMALLDMQWTRKEILLKKMKKYMK